MWVSKTTRSTLATMASSSLIYLLQNILRWRNCLSDAGLSSTSPSERTSCRTSFCRPGRVLWLASFWGEPEDCGDFAPLVFWLKRSLMGPRMSSLTCWLGVAVFLNSSGRRVPSKCLGWSFKVFEKCY